MDLGSREWLVSGILQMTSGILALLVKRVHEDYDGEHRPLADFSLDMSKQLLGMVWTWLLTFCLVGLSSIGVSESCSEQLFLPALEASAGLVMQYFTLQLVSRIAERVTQGSSDFKSGEYRNRRGKLSFEKFAKQLAVWLLCCTCATTVITMCIVTSLSSMVGISEILLGFVSWNGELEVVAVVVLLPCVTTAFQFWLTDGFLKKEGVPPWGAFVSFATLLAIGVASLGNHVSMFLASQQFFRQKTFESLEGGRNEPLLQQDRSAATPGRLPEAERRAREESNRKLQRIRKLALGQISSIISEQATSTRSDADNVSPTSLFSAQFASSSHPGNHERLSTGEMKEESPASTWSRSSEPARGRDAASSRIHRSKSEPPAFRSRSFEEVDAQTEPSVVRAAAFLSEYQGLKSMISDRASELEELQHELERVESELGLSSPGAETSLTSGFRGSSLAECDEIPLPPPTTSAQTIIDNDSSSTSFQRHQSELLLPNISKAGGQRDRGHATLSAKERLLKSPLVSSPFSESDFGMFTPGAPTTQTQGARTVMLGTDSSPEALDWPLSPTPLNSSETSFTGTSAPRFCQDVPDAIVRQAEDLGLTVTAFSLQEAPSSTNQGVLGKKKGKRSPTFNFDDLENSKVNKSESLTSSTHKASPISRKEARSPSFDLFHVDVEEQQKVCETLSHDGAAFIPFSPQEATTERRRNKHRLGQPAEHFTAEERSPLAALNPKEVDSGRRKSLFSPSFNMDLNSPASAPSKPRQQNQQLRIDKASPSQASENLENLQAPQRTLPPVPITEFSGKPPSENVPSPSVAEKDQAEVSSQLRQKSSPSVKITIGDNQESRNSQSMCPAVCLTEENVSSSNTHRFAGLDSKIDALLSSLGVGQSILDDQPAVTQKSTTLLPIVSKNQSRACLLQSPAAMSKKSCGLDSRLSALLQRSQDLQKREKAKVHHFA